MFVERMCVMKVSSVMEYRGREDGVFEDNGKRYSWIKLEEVETATQYQFMAFWDRAYTTDFRTLGRGSEYSVTLNLRQYKGDWKVSLDDIEAIPA